MKKKTIKRKGTTIRKQTKRLFDNETRTEKGSWFYASRLITFFLPEFLLSWCGMKNPSVRQAFREKLAICFLIFMLTAFIALLTFGSTRLNCFPMSGFQLEDVPNFTDRFVVRGRVYSLTTRADGSPFAHSPRLNNVALAGADLAFMFPLLSSACFRFPGIQPGCPTNNSIVG